MEHGRAGTSFGSGRALVRLSMRSCIPRVVSQRRLDPCASPMWNAPTQARWREAMCCCNPVAVGVANRESSGVA